MIYLFQRVFFSFYVGSSFASFFVLMFGFFQRFDASHDGLPLLTLNSNTNNGNDHNDKSSFIVCVEDDGGNGRFKICYYDVLSDKIMYKKGLDKLSEVIALTALRATIFSKSKRSAGRVMVTLNSGQLVMIQDNCVHDEDDDEDEDDDKQVFDTDEEDVRDGLQEKIPLFSSPLDLGSIDDNNFARNPMFKYLSDTTAITSLGLPSVSSLFQSFIKNTSSIVDDAADDADANDTEKVNIRQTSLGYNDTYPNHVNDNGRYDDPHIEMKRHAIKENNDNAAALSLYEESSMFCVGNGFKNLFDSSLKVTSMTEPQAPSTTVASKSIKNRVNSETTSINDETHAKSVGRNDEINSVSAHGRARTISEGVELDEDQGKDKDKGEQNVNTVGTRRRTRGSSIDSTDGTNEIDASLPMMSSSKRRKSSSIAEKASNTRKQQLSKLLSRVDTDASLDGNGTTTHDDSDGMIVDNTESNRKDQLKNLLKRVEGDGDKKDQGVAPAVKARGRPKKVKTDDDEGMKVVTEKEEKKDETMAPTRRRSARNTK